MAANFMSAKLFDDSVLTEPQSHCEQASESMPAIKNWSQGRPAWEQG